MFSKADYFNSVPFWQNGPAPGSIYNFPGSTQAEPTTFTPSGIQRTQ